MDPKTAENLLDTLEARNGIVAAIGAGGKKSTLYRLLEAHRTLATGRILLTSTVQIAAPPRTLEAAVMTIDRHGEPAAIDRIAGLGSTVMLTGPATKPGRFSGLPAALISKLHAEGAFRVTLVKADGARMRMIKAPREGEPALPGQVDTLLPIVSARAIGRPLDERIAHRPSTLADLLGIDQTTLLTPDHVARLLASPKGALRAAGDARVVPVITMADGPERLDLARETAIKALAMTDRFDRVVLAAMTVPSPLVEAVGR